LKRLIPYLLKKWFFWPPKLYCPRLAHEEKTFSSTLNIAILQMVRNECIRFGGHINIQVSYQILWLEVLKETPILLNLPQFQ
jgi:hypothetical protein